MGLRELVRLERARPRGHLRRPCLGRPRLPQRRTLIQLWVRLEARHAAQAPSGSRQEAALRSFGVGGGPYLVNVSYIRWISLPMILSIKKKYAPKANTAARTTPVVARTCFHDGQVT